jgi:sugar phosphate isomerase/epimerase
MKTSRRNFIKNSAVFGTALLAFPYGSYRFANASTDFPSGIGVCTDISNNGILANAGYTFVEEAVRNFLVPAEDEAIFQDKLSILKKSRLPVEACNSFIPGNMKSVGPAAIHDEIIKFAATSFRRAKVAGVKIIVFGSGGSRTIPHDYSKELAREQFITLCKRMAPIAEEHNVVIALEPLNSKECNFINSVAEGAEIVKDVNHKNFRLMADFYHMMMENESPDSIVKYKDQIYHVHIAEKAGRSAPGVNNEDFTPYFKALKKIGYNGRISIECNWTNLEEQAGKALQTIKNQCHIS